MARAANTRSVNRRDGADNRGGATTRALAVVVIIALVSLLVAFVLFFFLNSVVQIQDTRVTTGISLSGGIAGFVVVYELVFRTYLQARALETPGAPGVSELVSREEYIKAQVDAIGSAQSKVSLYLSRVQPSEKSSDAARINGSLRQAKARGVLARVLISNGMDRLPGAYELSEQLGVEVRVASQLSLSDLRFLRVDQDLAVIGIPQRVLEKASSDSWARIQSHILAGALDSEFFRVWEGATAFREYCSNEIQHVLAQRPYQYELIASMTGLPIDFVKLHALKSQSPTLEKNSAFLVYVIGRPGSGKSTIARLACGALLESDVEAIALSDYPYLFRAFADQSQEGRRYARCSSGGFLVLDEHLFDEAIYTLGNQILASVDIRGIILAEFSRRDYARVLRLLNDMGCVADSIVYVKASMETCLRRNELRRTTSTEASHYVSREEMMKTYSSDDLQDIRGQLAQRLVVIENELDGEANARRLASELAMSIKSRSRLAPTEARALQQDASSGRSSSPGSRSP